MYPKTPQSAVGEYTARTSCHQGAFSPSEALKSCTARKSCHPLMDLALAQGCLPPQRLANTRHLPMPATRCTHYSQRQAADGLRWRSFGAWPAVWPSPEGLPTTSSRGQADNGMLCRTGPEFQNREQVGAEPPAESAGPAGPASALPKTPIERTSPSWRSYRNTPPLKRRVSANSIACAFASAHKGRIRQNAYHRLGNTNQEHDAPPSPARTNRYRFSAERRW